MYLIRRKSSMKCGLVPTAIYMPCPCLPPVRFRLSFKSTMVLTPLKPLLFLTFLNRFLSSSLLLLPSPFSSSAQWRLRLFSPWKLLWARMVLPMVSFLYRNSSLSTTLMSIHVHRFSFSHLRTKILWSLLPQGVIALTLLPRIHGSFAPN